MAYTNSKLAEELPLEVDPHSFDNAHTKAHLLFQAHFTRLPLPSSDYFTDTKSVLDQAIRILQVTTGKYENLVKEKGSGNVILFFSVSL